MLNSGDMQARSDSRFCWTKTTRTPVLVGASVIGGSHRLQNGLCQDANMLSTQGNKSVLAVADGLGSSKYAEWASKMAVGLASEILMKYPAIDFSQLFKQIAEEIIAVGRQKNYEKDELHTTLLVALRHGNKYRFGQIGDGAIVIGKKGNYSRLFALDALRIRGAVNETNSLLDVLRGTKVMNLEIRIRRQFGPKVFLMTDGVTPVAVDSKTESAFSPFFKGIESFLILSSSNTSEANLKIKGFLETDRLAQKSDDDKTLCIGLF